MKVFYILYIILIDISSKSFNMTKIEKMKLYFEQITNSRAYPFLECEEEDEDEDEDENNEDNEDEF